MPRTRKYDEMTVKDLTAEAKKAGLTGYSDMNKEELVQALEKQLPPRGSRRSSRGDLPGILTLLKEEHDEVKDLFDEFETQAESDVAAAAPTAETIMRELVRHAEMEERIVYPGLQEADPDTYFEAHEEHHVAEVLIGELQELEPGDTYKAKMIVLAENIRHHIDEEESEAFEALRTLPEERLDGMADEWKEMKAAWKPSAAMARNAR